MARSGDGVDHGVSSCGSTWRPAASLRRFQVSTRDADTVAVSTTIPARLGPVNWLASVEAAWGEARVGEGGIAEVELGRRRPALWNHYPNFGPGSAPGTSPPHHRRAGAEREPVRGARRSRNPAPSPVRSRPAGSRPGLGARRPRRRSRESRSGRRSFNERRALATSADSSTEALRGRDGRGRLVGSLEPPGRGSLAVESFPWRISGEIRPVGEVLGSVLRCKPWTCIVATMLASWTCLLSCQGMD